MDLVRKLLEYEGGEITVKVNEPLSRHSSFGIGGEADVLILPKNKEELLFSVEKVKESGEPFRIFGNGTNVLFHDAGYRGALIFTKNMREISFDGERVCAQSGASLSALSLAAAKRGLSGLEFACGIPGTVGGAVYMNAGAYGSEMSAVTLSSEYLDLSDMTARKMSEHGFDYRYSVYKDMNSVILSAELLLVRDSEESIRERMREYSEKRRSSQPHGAKSAGSTFKRNPPYITAKLIDDAGLKGRSVGDAEVSAKHAGFIVNKGNASAKDVLELIDIVKEEVFAKFGVSIECEIIIVDEGC